jgi:hydroxypyruvate isomerase
MWKLCLGINGFAVVGPIHNVKVTYEEVLEHAAKLGYDGIELDGRDGAGIAPYPDVHDAATVAAYARNVTSYGLEVVGIQAGVTRGEIGSPDQSSRLEWGRCAVEQVEFCHAMGGVQCGFWPAMKQPDLPQEEVVSRMSEALRPVAARAEELGLMTTIEPEAIQLAYNYALAARVVDAVGSPNFRLIYDCGHAQMLDGDALEAVTRYAGYIGHVHFCDSDDSNFQNVARHLGTGEGTLDLNAILNALRDVGYDRWVQADVWGHPEPFRASRLLKGTLDAFLAA